MTDKILIKALIRLDRFIEKFQNFLQGARVKIIETVWDLKEKGQRENLEFIVDPNML